MKLITAMACALLVATLSACTFPDPSPGDTKMAIDVNSSEWAVLSPSQKEAEVEGYEEESPAVSQTPY